MRLTRKLARGSALLLLAIAGVVLFVQTASAQEYAVSGNWTSTSITGSGTWDAHDTGEITSGTISIVIVATVPDGHTVGTCVYTGTYYADQEAWHGRSPAISGNVIIDGNTHPARLWLVGRYENLILVPINLDADPYIYGWSLDVSCPAGGTHAWTTDGSEIVVDFGWSGSGLGTIAFNWNGTWEIRSGGVGVGTWSGVANECLAGKTQGVVAGTGTVSLSGSPEVARLIYDVQTAGTVLLARYKTNPGGAPPKQDLGTYIQVASNIISPEITWPVELRVYYTDTEVAAVGIGESTLKLYKWGGTNWTVVPETGVNTTDNYVWAKLYSFSAYAPLGDKGDIDGDGVINLLDVRLCLQIATGVIAGTAAQQTAADVDGDGDVDLADAQLLAKYVMGIEDEL